MGVSEKRMETVEQAWLLEIQMDPDHTHIFGAQWMPQQQR
jgi:hypothetical protein